MTTRDLPRLATFVARRRVELRLGIEPAARSVGMSKDTWKKVEGLPEEAGPQPVRAATYARVDEALKWVMGSCEAIMEGGLPSEIESIGNGASMISVPQDDLGEEIQQAVHNAFLAAKDLSVDLSVSDVRKVNERIIEELIRRGIVPDSSPK